MLSESTRADYDSLRQQCGYLDWNQHTRLELTGEDRAKFLHNYCTNDINRLSPGQGCEAFIPNGQGKCIGFVHVYCEPERLIIETVANQAQTLLAHFDRFVLRAKVQFHDVSSSLRCFLLAGPSANELLGTLFELTLPSGALASATREWQGQKIWIARTALLAEDSYLVAVDPAAASELNTAFQARGIRQCGQGAFETLRIESGTPLFGIDVTPDNLPQELGVDTRAVNFNKGCYLGQETIARIDAMGHVNWHFCGLRVLDPVAPTVPGELKVQDKTVARMTSITWSPTVQAPFALGFVRRGHHRPGTVLESAEGKIEVAAIPLRTPE